MLCRALSKHAVFAAIARPAHTIYTCLRGHWERKRSSLTCFDCRRRKREERYWLVESLWVYRLVSCCCARGGGSTLPQRHRRRHTSHHAPATTLAFLDDGVLLTAVLCTSLHSLWARGCVDSAAVVAVKRWWKLERPVQTISSTAAAPDQQNFFPFFQRHFFFCLSSS